MPIMGMMCLGVPPGATWGLKVQHTLNAGNAYNFSAQCGLSSVPAAGALSTGMIWQNNIFMSLGATPGTLFIKLAGTPNSSVVLRNCCFWTPNAASPSTTNVITWDGVAYTVASFATYVAANPGLGIQFSGCIQADPQLVYSGSDPVGIAPGSPCKNAGYAAGVVTDFGRNVRS